MSGEDTRETRSLWIALILCLVAIGVGGYFLSVGLVPLRDERINDGLNGVATTGGIVSGLSLSGTAVLSLNGNFRKQVLSRYGTIIRGVFFGGYALVVFASFACALSTVWIEEDWVRFVLGFSVPVILVVTLATALLVNNAFAIQDRESLTSRPGPY